jgi:REP element-mobilizing transposase RayT
MAGEPISQYLALNRSYGGASALPSAFRPTRNNRRIQAQRGTNCEVNRYQRRLPHWDAVGARIFVTFSLNGSIPASRAFHSKEVSAGHVFVAVDRLLDHARAGPLFLRLPHIAELVTKAIYDGDLRFRRYNLHAFVVMPNHVHLLATSKAPLAKWLGALKGFTGHKALELLDHPGPFWQNESYDHLVRNDEEFRRILRYIEWNPVKAGLAAAPEDFAYSSAGQKARGSAEAPPYN